jgi:hypothetical protein
MKVYQVIGYPKSHYFVKQEEWHEMICWLYQNKIDFLQESCSQHGIGFSLRKNVEWFLLRWL